MDENRLRVAGYGLLSLLICAGNPAMADGAYFQFDYAENASSTVLTVQRGAAGLSLGWSEWDTGEATTAYVSRSWPLPLVGAGASLKLGPSFRHEAGGEDSFGLRLVVEQYRATDWGGLFLLGDVNTIADEYQLLAEWGFAASGIAVSASVQGDEGDFREQTLAVSYRFGESPFRIRLGHRIESEVTFVGLSVNTF